MRRLAILGILLLLLPLVLAANDPGHDTLYVLLTGDSAITGTLNISSWLNATTIRAANLIYGDQLDIRGNGSIYTVASRPAIQADSSDLYLDSNGNVYIGTKGGTSGVVQVGASSGSSITLNVSGIIYEQGTRVCLANGTNCLGGNNTGNISQVSAGNGISVANPTGPTATVSISASTCTGGDFSYWDGNSWECATDQTGGSMSSFIVGGDSGALQTITNGNTFNITGGTSITTIGQATDIVNIDVTDDSITGTELADSIALDAALSFTGNTVTVSSTANPGLIVGDGNTGYIRIGGTGSLIYDNAGDLTIDSDSGELDILDNVSVVGGNISIQSTYNMCFNNGCTARIYHNGSALIIEGQ